MSFEEMLAKARLEYGDADGNSTKIYVAASLDIIDSASICAVFRKGIEESGIAARVIAAGSLGYYDLEPVVIIERPGQPALLYANVTAGTALSIVQDGLAEGKASTKTAAFCTLGAGTIEGVPSAADLPLFNGQNRIALRNCGFVDPMDIADYLLRGGYDGFSRVLQKVPADVIDEVKQSGLRGRGGAGYPTADKWFAVREERGDEKYLICNAIDGDPLARTAQLLLTSDPHSILEGMLIAAYAVGSSRAILCVAAGQGVLVERLLTAVDQAGAYGLTGENILDSGFTCHVAIQEISGSLVAGEETALLRALAGKQAMPYLRPPYPETCGFRDMPTLINCAETYACVSAIFEKGAPWFAAVGTETSKGSKVVTLSGAVVHPYTVEVPFGTSLESIVRGIGGGVVEARQIKAVQFGGPTGIYLAPDALGMALSFDALSEAGSITGSGTIEVQDDRMCAVEALETLVAYLQTQSCGKCVFCREGTFQISDIIKDIREQAGKPQDLDLIQELGEQMKIACICGLGRNVPNPVLSSIRLFRHDYDAHIRDKKCSVNVPS